MEATKHNKIMVVKDDKKRVKYFDIARGIAIILMIVGHTLDFGWKRNLIFSFHMPLFIIISGMFFKERDIKSFLINITKKLIIPYIITIFITNLIKALTIDKNIDILLFVKEYIMQILYSFTYLKIKTNIKGIGVLWFFPLLAIIRIIFYILKKISKEDKILLGALCILLSYIGYILGMKEKWLLFSADVALSCLIFYYIGYILYNKKILEKILSNKKLLLVILIIWLIGIKFSWIELAVRRYPDGLFCYIIGICGTIVVLKISKIIEQKSLFLTNILSWYGRNSMYILLIHHVERELVNYKDLYKNILNKKSLYKFMVIFLKMTLCSIGTMIINYISKFIMRMTKKDEECRN